jgi:hypothetical protein
VSMEYRPVGEDVASAEVRDWRLRNYEADALRQPGGTLDTVMDRFDELLHSAERGMSGESNDLFAKFQRTGEVMQLYVPPDGQIIGVTTSYNLTATQYKRRANIPLREKSEIRIVQHDHEGFYVRSASYIVSRFAGGAAEMLMTTSEDEAVQDVSDGEWREGTEYDAAQLLDELAVLQQIQTLRPETYGTAEDMMPGQAYE